jgi:hypothetical protein
MIGVSSPGRGWEFFSSPPRQARPWGPPSLLSIGYQGLFLWGVKRPGCEVDHSPPSNFEVECVELYLHSHYAFMAWCSVCRCCYRCCCCYCYVYYYVYSFIRHLHTILPYFHVPFLYASFIHLFFLLILPFYCFPPLSIFYDFIDHILAGITSDSAKLILMIMTLTVVILKETLWVIVR